MTNTVSTSRRKLRTTVALAAYLLGTAAAAAHPHVWITNRSDVVFNEAGMITAISVEWAFDKNYSADAIEGLDTNGDETYSTDELEPLVRENITALKEYDYFVYAKFGDKKVAYGEITEYGQTHSYDILKMYMTIPLATPVDPKKAQFTYAIYDPSFFIAIDYPDASAVSSIGTPPAGCTVELKQTTSDQQADETREMLSDKPADWQPETEEDFGSLFAQPVNVACKPKTASK